MSVTFAGKCSWRSGVVTGGDRYMLEVQRALLARGAKVRWVREPALPVNSRVLIPVSVLWSFCLNGWYVARRKELRSSVVFEDYSSRTRLFLSNRSFRRPRGPGVVSLVQGFYHPIPRNPLMRGLESELASRYLKSVDLVIANSRSTAAEASRLGADSDRIRVVYPGVDDAFLRVEPAPKSSAGRRMRLLFVGGQCKPVKGLEYFISALGLLRGRDFAVSIVGDTEGCDFRPYVRKLMEMSRKLGIEDRVRFTGSLSPRNGLLDLYEESDVFVLPSLWEGYGIAAVEAMCFGLPVVATRAGGLAEVVRHEETGLLVPPRDPEALAGALAEIMDDRSRWKEMSEAAAARARQLRRSWESVGRECVGHIEGLWRACAA